MPNSLHGKLLALDVDGTLLDANGRLRKRTRLAIQAASDSGSIVSLATGRDWLAVEKLIEILPSVQYAVCTNGIEVYDREGHRLTAREIDLDIAQTTIHSIRQKLPGVAIGVGVRGQLVGEPDIAKALPAMPAGVTSFPAKIVPDVMEEMTSNSQDIVVYHADYHSRIEDLYRIVGEIVQDKQIDVVFSGLPMVEIVPAGCGKETGLSWLCSHLEIASSEVIAFGDGMNDLSMLEWAGKGIAMGQSGEKVIGYADEVTLANSEDGVAVWIETQLLAGKQE